MRALGPGDVLYVPRGWVHEVHTRGVDTNDDDDANDNINDEGSNDKEGGGGGSGSGGGGSLHLTFRAINGHFFRWGKFLAYGVGIGDPSITAQGPTNYALAHPRS